MSAITFPNTADAGVITDQAFNAGWREAREEQVGTDAFAQTFVHPKRTQVVTLVSTSRGAILEAGVVDQGKGDFRLASVDAEAAVLVWLGLMPA